ncbi:DUF3566 domain-containing protein [Rhodococcus sp. NPDC054953]
MSTPHQSGSDRPTPAGPGPSGQPQAAKTGTNGVSDGAASTAPPVNGGSVQPVNGGSAQPANGSARPTPAKPDTAAATPAGPAVKPDAAATSPTAAPAAGKPAAKEASAPSAASESAKPAASKPAASKPSAGESAKPPAAAPTSGTGPGAAGRPAAAGASGEPSGSGAQASGRSASSTPAASRPDQGATSGQQADRPGQGRPAAAARPGAQTPPWQRGTQSAAAPATPAKTPPASGKAAAAQAGTGTPAAARPAAQQAATAQQPAARPAGQRPADPARAAKKQAAQAKAAVIDGPTRHIDREDLAKDLPDLSEIKHPTPVATEKVPARKPPVVVAATTPIGDPLRASVQVRKIDPWSALKVALVLSVAMFFVWMFAIGFLYLVLDGMGVWDRLNNAFTDIISESSDSGLVTAGQVFGYSALIGGINIVLFTALATVGAFIYNLCTDLVGGVEVTLADRD